MHHLGATAATQDVHTCAHMCTHTRARASLGSKQAQRHAQALPHTRKRARCRSCRAIYPCPASSNCKPKTHTQGMAQQRKHRPTSTHTHTEMRHHRLLTQQHPSIGCRRPQLHCTAQHDTPALLLCMYSLLCISPNTDRHTRKGSAPRTCVSQRACAARLLLTEPVCASHVHCCHCCQRRLHIQGCCCCCCCCWTLAGEPAPEHQLGHTLALPPRCRVFCAARAGHLACSHMCTH
jgi:hypothetical protein